MQTQDGQQGLVPVNYIDKLDIPEAQVNNVSPTGVAGSGGLVNSTPPQANSMDSSSPPDTPSDEVIACMQQHMERDNHANASTCQMHVACQCMYCMYMPMCAACSSGKVMPMQIDADACDMPCAHARCM